MNVTLVHNDYGRFSGEEEAVERLASLLLERGHKVSWLRKKSLDHDAPVGRKVRALFNGVWSPSSAQEMAGLLTSCQPDIVQVQNLYPFVSSSVLPVCRARSVPVVMRCPNYRLFCPSGLHLREGKICERCMGPLREINCVRFNCERSFAKSTGYAVRNAFNRVTGSIIDNVDQFIVLSEFQRDRFVRAGIAGDRISVVPNAAPVETIEATSVPDGGAVGFVGRLSAEKGIVEFLEVARANPDIPFRIAGSAPAGWETPSRLPGNVSYAGFLSAKALDDFYRDMRILVFPSKWFEGFPNVIARAMAHGRPVVAFDIGAIPEIVRHGTTGLLVPTGSVAAMSNALRDVWRDRDLCARMGHAARSAAEHDYCDDAVYGALMAAYRRAIGGSP